MSDEVKKTGRPTDYSDELGAEICVLIAEKGCLRYALQEPGMPGESTVYRWLGLHETFREMYTRARQQGDEADAERMRDIAYDQDIPADQKRIMVDVLKWQLARRTPKKWGERVQQEVSGPNGGPIQLTKILLGDLEDDD